MIFDRISIIVILTILSNEATCWSQTFTSDRLLLTRNSRFRPMVTKIYDQLIYVSFPSYPEPKIKMESEKIGYSPCEIFLATDEIEYPIGVESLANGKLIISFLSKRNTGEYYLLNIIVNLDTCTSLSITTMLNASSVVNTGWRKPILVLPGENEFDIFVSNYSKCNNDKACRLRFNDKGEFVRATTLDWLNNATSWSISTVNEKDFSKGYFYTAFMDNGTTIKRLDKNLKVEDIKLLNRTFLHSDIYGAINSCHGISKYELECKLMNKYFRTRASATINMQPYKDYIRRAQLFNLADGTALVFLVLQVYTEPTEATYFSSYLHHLDLYGRVSRPIKFQEDLCKDFGDILISQMTDTISCISIACRDAVRTKCIVFAT